MNNLILLIERSLNRNNIISEDLEYHITNGQGVDKNIFRPGSKKFFDLFVEARELNKKGLYYINENEDYYLNETDIGEWGFYEGQRVPLDYPFVIGEEDFVESQINEKEKKRSKKVKLNKPFRGGTKKYRVYVKDPETGKIKKIAYGSPGMRVKVSDPARRKSFAARHQCEKYGKGKENKTSARYWACRLDRSPHLTGSKKKYKWW